MEEIINEYNYLLSGQLEAQRDFYQRQLTRLEQDMKEQLNAAQNRLRALKQQAVDLQNHQEVAQKGIEQSRLLSQALEAELTTKEAETTELQLINRELLGKQKLSRTKVDTLEERHQQERKHLIGESDAKISALEEEIRELEFHFKAQKQIARANTAPDAINGQLIVPQASDDSESPSKCKSKKSRAKKTKG